MLQGVTNPCAVSDEKILQSAASKVQEQLDQLTVFDSHRADLRQIMGAGLAVLKELPPLSEAQLHLAAEYEDSLPQLERACLWLHRRHRKRPQEIAEQLNVRVEWVRRTNARHLTELAALLRQ
jgi:hypothetical protein